MEVTIGVRGVPVECQLQISACEEAWSVCRRACEKLGLKGVEAENVRLAVDEEVVGDQYQLQGGFSKLEVVVDDREPRARLEAMGVAVNEDAMRGAAAVFDYTTVNLLHKAGVPFYKEVLTDLCAAATPGDLDKLRWLFNIVKSEGGMDMTWYTSSTGKTPFHVCKTEHIAMIKEFGVDINQACHDGYAPIHILPFGNMEEIRAKLIELLANGAHADATERGKTALMMIMDVRCAAALVDAGADVNHKCHAGRRPLHVACMFGEIEVAKFLVRKGAYINARDECGYTALHIAVDSGKADAVAYMLSIGADVNIRTWDDVHPYDTALEAYHLSGTPEQARILADIRRALKTSNFRTRFGRFFDRLCCCADCRPSCVKLPPCTSSRHEEPQAIPTGIPYS